MSLQNYSSFKHFVITSPAQDVAHVQINRPEKFNAFFEEMWIEFGQIFDKLSLDSDFRAIILSGAGDKAFTAGLDVQAASQTFAAKEGDIARIAFGIRHLASSFQKCVASVERCEKPVICVLHGFSFGLAIDIATGADIRICAKDTKFSVKEVDIGMAADVGTLSRLPKIVGNFGWVKDVCLTARTFGADEALQQGLVSQVHDTKEKAVNAAVELAKFIATKSPIAIHGTKELLNHARDNSMAESLRYTAVWASAAMQATDVKSAMLSGLQKRTPTFEKL